VHAACRQIINNLRSLNLRCKDGMPLEAIITAGLAHRNIIATLAHFWTSRNVEMREVILSGSHAVERFPREGIGLGPGWARGSLDAAERDAGPAPRQRGLGLGPALGPARARMAGAGAGGDLRPESGRSSPTDPLWDSANDRRRIVDQRGAGEAPSDAPGGARPSLDGCEDEMWLVMDYCDRGCLLVLLLC